jgi:TolA-binding protein
LGEVLNRYPNASAAVLKRTQQELARLKCPS